MSAWKCRFSLNALEKWRKNKQTLKQNKKINAQPIFFNKTWTCNYLLTEVWGESVYFVCGEQIAVSESSHEAKHDKYMLG